jgi:hypothetical protein
MASLRRPGAVWALSVRKSKVDVERLERDGCRLVGIAVDPSPHRTDHDVARDAYRFR